MSKWIELETDASTGKPYLWKCDECGEEVETRWNYCPECGDPKTNNGKSINTLVKALETEHRKLREMQYATDKNVGTTDTISRQAVLDIAFKYCPDDDGVCSEAGSDLRNMLDEIENLPSAEPKRGRWILDRSGAYCCSECMEPCAGYVMMKPRDKFCKMCGARMTEGDAE